VAPAMTPKKRNRVRERWAQRGFSPADLLNLLKPNGAWARFNGLAYDKGSRQKLDVYRPRHAAKAPVLVFFYGGSWQGGSPLSRGFASGAGHHHGRAGLLDLSASAFSHVCRGRRASGALCPRQSRALGRRSVLWKRSQMPLVCGLLVLVRV
jgi:hypothetical protein